MTNDVPVNLLTSCLHCTC